MAAVADPRQILKAMAVVRRPRDGALLVSEHVDSRDPPFQRPLGGHVEFGEYALDTVRREFAEEIGQDGHDRGQKVIATAFAAASAYEIEEQPILDNPDRRVLWRPADAISPPLYPAGLTELIASQLT